MKKIQPKFTIAARVVAKPQRLRADETTTATTFALNYAAKFQAAWQPSSYWANTRLMGGAR